METTNADHYAVVQDDYQSKDWLVAAELLTEILGLPPITARQQARKSYGYLAVNLPQAAAQRLRDACAARGLGVQLVPQGDVIPIIKPARMHQVWIAEDALWVRATDLDAKTPLAWDMLHLMAFSKTTKKELFRHWKTIGFGEEERLSVTTYTENYAEYLADVFAIQPHGRVFAARFLSRELNFAEALGDLAPDALVDANARTDGFRLLLSSIAARAPQMHNQPESLAFMSQGRGEVPGSRPLSRWLTSTALIVGPCNGCELKGYERIE